MIVLKHLFRPVSRPISLSVRGHKTTARTKRSLKISPHDSFLPSSSAETTIIYNPPASEASPLHTPHIFLPAADPRRSSSHSSGIAHTDAAREGDKLPPALRYKRRQPKYHLTKEHIDEMRRLRADDPITWSVGHLAQKFDCSPIFVQMAAPAPADHLAWLREKMARKMDRWGPIRRLAREERKTRAEMLYRGEL